MTAEAIRAALACGRPGCACHRPGGKVTHCPVHEPDRRPSLGVDDRGGRVLVHCRAGCPQFEVLAALRARGLWALSGIPHPRRPRSPLNEARAWARAEIRRQRARLAPYQDLSIISDFIRSRLQAAAAARRVATARGDCEPTWGLLARAATLEAEARMVESEVDECLPLPLHENLDAPLAGRRSA